MYSADALAPGGLLVGKQEQKIDVGAGREQAAPVAACGDDGHALGGGRVRGAVDVAGGEVVGEPDQRVLEGGEALGAGPPVAVLLKLAPGLPSARHRRAARKRSTSAARSERSCPE